MKVLYLDTSSSFLFTGIVEKGKLLVERKVELNQDLSKDSLPIISEMFSSINISPKNIDKIIVVDGPGSFTGIRIGITIAKIYACTLNKHITTINSLEAMALSNEDYDYYVPMIDARRGFVYSAIYNREYNEILFPQHTKISTIENNLTKLNNYLIITNDDIEISGPKVEYDPNILRIVEKFKDKKNINPHSINPNYLKLTEAEEKLISNRQ